MLWRATGDKISAFYDLCLHRGAALSLGWIDGDTLVCPYHGWNYAGDGRCVKIPSLPPDREIPAKARAKSYHVQERHSLVWVCLDEPLQDIPEFPPEVGDPTFTWSPYNSDGQWKANAARMIENLADFSPLSFGPCRYPRDPASVRVARDRHLKDLSKSGFLYEIDTPVNRPAAAKSVETTLHRDPAVHGHHPAQPTGRQSSATPIFICARRWRTTKPVSSVSPDATIATPNPMNS